MRFLPQLFASNRTWAARQTRRDPAFFERLCAIQKPAYLWIGCADSRVPANEIVGLAPGELFVHRNVANIVRPDDRNCLAVLQYAIGVEAAIGPPTTDPLEGWIAQVRATLATHADELAALPDKAARSRRLCELNVIAQVQVLSGLPTVLRAWDRGQSLAIHGWIYDLRDGLLRDLEVSRDAATHSTLPGDLGVPGKGI
jgi:carbonic anhydrase